MDLDYTAEDVKLIRERRRMSQEQLAEFVGCEPCQVRRWEAGKVTRIQARFLRRLDELAAKPALPESYSPEHLRLLRRRLRLTQAELALAIDHEIGSVKFWETGRRVKQEPRALAALDALAAKAGMFETKT